MVCWQQTDRTRSTPTAKEASTREATSVQSWANTGYGWREYPPGNDRETGRCHGRLYHTSCHALVLCRKTPCAVKIPTRSASEVSEGSISTPLDAASRFPPRLRFGLVWSFPTKPSGWRCPNLPAVNNLSPPKLHFLELPQSAILSPTEHYRISNSGDRTCHRVNH